MAVKSKRRSGKPAIPKDDEGNPDIYQMRENGMTLEEAIEATGLPGSKAFRLYIKQEVEHNPDQVISTKGPRPRLAKKLFELRRDEKMRWERLMARTGLSRPQVEELVREGAEAAGEDPDEFVTRRANAVEEDEDTPKKGKKSKKGKKAKAEPVEDEEDDTDEDEDEEDEEPEDEAEEDEDEEDEDEEDEDEEEEPAPPRRTRSRKSKK